MNCALLLFCILMSLGTMHRAPTWIGETPVLRFYINHWERRQYTPIIYQTCNLLLITHCLSLITLFNNFISVLCIDWRKRKRETEKRRGGQIRPLHQKIYFTGI